MRRPPLHELPVAITEPIGSTGTEIAITHVGRDSDGLPRARVTVSRGEIPLATDVVRLERDTDRRRLIRAALREDEDRLVEMLRGSKEGGGNGNGADGANGGHPTEADAANLSPPLTGAEIERALLRAGEALRAVGMPPEDRRDRSPHAPAQAHAAEGDAESTEAKRPYVLIHNDLAEFADYAQQLLLAWRESEIYKRARMLVRVTREKAPKAGGITRPSGAPVIEPISLAHLRDLLARSGEWHVLTDEGPRRALPPKWVAETLLARGDWPFARLEGVIETPTLRPDGTIIETPGYDPATGFLYEPNAEFPSVPQEPNADELVTAVQTILEPFSEFPFVADSDRSAALAAVLTLVARSAIEGPTPLFAIRATAPGTGKGLLASVASLIGTGREPTLFAVSREDEEVRKRLLTIGLEGTRCILLDNVEGTIGSPALAAALTATAITDRVLGTNRLATVPLGAVWMTTGNNIAFRGDLGRRVLPIDLNANVEFPEDRTFLRGALSRWVQQERPRLVVAALTLLRGFYAAGCPQHRESRVGSFEGWDSVVRATLMWLGCEDPCAGRQRVRTESDPDLEMLGALLDAWWRAFGSEPQTLARAIESAFGAGGDEDLAAALASLDTKSDGRRPRARPVGDRFRRWKGRIANGLLLATNDRKEHGAALWHVRKVGETEPSGGVGETGESVSFDSGFQECGEEIGREERERYIEEKWESAESDSPTPLTPLFGAPQEVKTP
jgi:hypothetical protein